MGVLHGRNIIIMDGGHAFAMSRSCEITSDCDLIEKSSSTDSEYKHYEKGRKGWRVIINYLAYITTVSNTVHSSLESLLAEGQTYTLRFGVRDAGTTTVQLEGEAICKTVHISGGVGNLAQGSFEFVGNGPLSRYTPPST